MARNQFSRGQDDGHTHVLRCPTAEEAVLHRGNSQDCDWLPRSTWGRAMLTANGSASMIGPTMNSHDKRARVFRLAYASLKSRQRDRLTSAYNHHSLGCDGDRSRKDWRRAWRRRGRQKTR